MGSVSVSTIVLNGNRCPARSVPRAVLVVTPCIIYYSKSTSRRVQEKFAPSTVVNSKSSLSPRGGRQFEAVFRRVSSRRAGSRAGTMRFLLSRNGGAVVLINTANGQRSRALKGVDLLVSCVGTKTRMAVLASRKVFVPTSKQGYFGSCPKRRVSVFGFGTAKLETSKLMCPLDSFDG